MIRPGIALAAAVALAAGLGLPAVLAADPPPLADAPALVSVRDLAGAVLGPAATQAAVRRSDAEWRASLTADAYRILRRQGTERLGSSALLDEHRAGWFLCTGCALPLFRSEDKFESGSGWPSFIRPADPGQILRIDDRSHGMVRTEIRCARCGGHLGHVFDDGPAPTGERHCLNGVALRFVPDAGAGSPPPAHPSAATAAPPASGPGAAPAP
ncbi:MAG: hypothetical protein RLZZ127_1019 [Planctomycetota bacterium]|jgi:peptide-methionine (R)-S-oxide reductase